MSKWVTYFKIIALSKDGPLSVLVDSHLRYLCYCKITTLQCWMPPEDNMTMSEKKEIDFTSSNWREICIIFLIYKE